MKALIFNFFVVVLVATSCGKRTKNSDKDSTDNLVKSYYLCSEKSYYNGCTNTVSRLRALRAYELFDRYCYEEYIRCLKVRGVSRQFRR